jgi:NADP-dependent 3-hydroxy acid dehydrogenase YdfG
MRGKLVTDLNNKIVALTGAGSGIGLGTAMALARRGAHLALSDINEEGLNETAAMVGDAGGKVTTQVLDVSDEEAFNVWADSVIADYGRVDVVINNAGVTLAAIGAEQSHDDLDWVMSINFRGVAHGTRAFLPHMLERNSGHVVNISSVFGLFGVPAQSAYCASKFAVRGYSDAIRVELRNSNVQMTVVHPGGISTNIANHARFRMQGEGVPDRDAFVANANKMLSRTTPAKAGEVIARGIEKNKSRVLIGGDAKYIDIMQRLMPARFPLMMSSN